MATLKYRAVPVSRIMIERVSSTDDVTVVEEVGLVAEAAEAQRAIRALTEYARNHPEDHAVRVLAPDDVEIH